MKKTLEIENLSIDFGGVSALRGVDLSVDRDSFVGLIGPNGAGKTTLINCISRIYKPKSGRILFEGTDIGGLRGDQVSQLGIARTFQNLDFLSTISEMSVLDYLRLGQFGSSRHGLLRDGFQTASAKRNEAELTRRARRILDFFRSTREMMEPSQEERGYPILYGRDGFPDLIDVEYRPIGILSFAWRRRLDLARALVSNPKFLLLDEPAQGLPPSEIENLGRLLRMIKGEFKVGALIVEHNFAMLSQVADSIVVMDSGQKLAEGSPKEIRTNPKVVEVYFGTGAKAVEAARRPEAPKAGNGEAPILEVDGLEVFYGHAQALFGISMKLYPRQVASVLGTNGSGKSTLLRAIGGVERPRFGEIRVAGQYLPLGRPEFAAERGIQYIPQGRALFGDLTVRSNLSLGAHVRSGRKQEIAHTQDRVLGYFPQLRDLLDVPASKLSGGQQQMLTIAQGLMAEPSILLLDEPSLGLSPAYVDLIFSVIKRISSEERCAILLVEQNVAKALEVSDYVYMLNSGILMGEGETSKFAENREIINKSLGFY